MMWHEKRKRSKWDMYRSRLTCSILCLVPRVSGFWYSWNSVRTVSKRHHSPLSVVRIEDNCVTLQGQILSPEEFERRSRINAVIEALQVQLPLTLTKPLTAVSAKAAFSDDVKLTVCLDQEDIDLLQSRDELIALSDVLVLGTSTAQQANSVFASFSSSSTSNDTATKIDCQILLDASCQILMVPWKAKAPGFLGSFVSSSSSTSQQRNLDTFEGLSEFFLNAKGEVERHRLRKVLWNGQVVNGPAIGQTLRALQSTMSNVQNSPFLRGLMGGDNGNTNNNVWTGMRDGFLEQAATAASSRNGGTTTMSQSPPLVLPVASTEDVRGFVDPSANNGTISSSLLSSTSIPLPGTPHWKDYAHTHNTLVDFCERVIPLLSSVEDISSYFTPNATLLGTQGNQLLKGRKTLSNFFQGLALARQSTGGTWRMHSAEVLEWNALPRIAINYTATNTPWTIEGQDVYTLTTIDGDRPVICDIRQIDLSVTTPDGSVALDGPWVMKNLASAVERSSSPTALGPNIRDRLTDVLFQEQQQLILGGSRSAGLSVKKPKVSQIAAATAFSFMTELHNSLPELWNTTTSSSTANTRGYPLPPAAEYLADNVELRGYLGERLLRGSNVYTRALGSWIAATRQALTQKRLMLDRSATAVPRVELTPKGKVRLTLVAGFRVPPLGGGALFPETASVPLNLEIVSDYTLDSQTGLVTQHQLVETRVNGQLTPGDVWSKNLQRFLNLEQDTTSSSTSRRSNEDFLKGVTDAMRWLQSFSSNSGQ